MGLLDGVVIADFTRIFAGPFCTQILGDLGAEVIKVERPEIGDDSRVTGVTNDGPNTSTNFLAMNRNKRSIAIDLKNKEGVSVARRLATQADVLIQNFRPGVMERLGLGYEDLREDCPRLIYCEISGYGSKGPLRLRGANDLCMQAFSGQMSITGEPGRPPVRAAASICDLTAGLYAAIGILAALIERERSGLGQRVETSMLGGQLNMLNYFISDYLRRGIVPQKMGSANPLSVPNQAFPTKDGYICITVPNDRVWQRACRALGIPDVAQNSRFTTLGERLKYREEVVAIVSAATGALTTKEAEARLDEEGVPCAPVKTIPEVAADPQVAALGCLANVTLSSGETVPLVQTQLEYSRSEVGTRLPPPEHGQHTDQILAMLGYSEDEVRALHRSRAVGVVA